MNFKVFIEIVKSRFGFLILVLTIVVATSAAFTFTQVKTYSASSSLVLTFQDSGPFEQLGIPTQLAASYMATQVDIVVSRNVALKVIDRLGILDSTASMNSFLVRNNGSMPDELEENTTFWIADILLEGISVRPARESRVLTLDYECADAELAAQVADAFGQAYIDATLELSMEPARRNAAWFDEQLQMLQVQLEEQQQALTAYQQEHGIVAIDEQLDTETKRLEDLSSKLTAAQAETFDVQSRQLGDQHPEYIRAMEQQQSLQRSLDRQKANVLEVKQQRDLFC